MSAGQVVAGLALVVIAVAVVGGFFYGGYRIIRNRDWPTLWAFLGLWLVGFGWLVGLIYVLGPDRRARLARHRGEPVGATACNET